METKFKNKPRVFKVKNHSIIDLGKIYLDSNEMISFVTKDGRECDFAAKEWGFYLGPSLNSRLKGEGFKTALAINENNQLYVLAVEKDKIDLFRNYLKDNQEIKILSWLDEWL